MISLDKKIFINTSYQIGGKIAFSLLGFLSTALLTRYLGVEQFGTYSLIFTISGFITIIADFGLSTLTIREVASDRYDGNSIRVIFSLRFYLALLAIGVSTLVSFFLPFSSDIKTGVVLATIGGVILHLSAVFWSYHQAKYKFGKVVLIQLLTGVINFLLTLLFIRLHFSLLQVVSLSIITNLFGFLLSIGEFRVFSLLITQYQKFKQILLEVWPFGIGLVVSIVYFKLDVLILSTFYNPVTNPDVSYYSVAYRVFEVLLVFAGYFTQTLFPLFSKLIHTKNFHRIVVRYFLITLLLAVIGGVGTYLFAPLLIHLLGGNEFIPSIEALRILSLGLSLSILSGFFLNIAIAGNKQRTLLIYAFSAIVINGLLNFLVIPRFSYLGASVVTNITQFFILCGYIYTSLKVLRS